MTLVKFWNLAEARGMSDQFYSLHMLLEATIWGYDSVRFTAALANEENP